MANDSKVSYQSADGVAIVTIANPPVNAGSSEVRRGLIEAIARAQADPAVAAIVLTGDGGNFMGGADLREFGQPLAEPQLPAVIAAIEACAKPVVAAIAGAALGGGLELALGCDYRVGDPSTVVGLPEVTLGMVPGAGGTQRLPRLVGVAKAIELVTRGTRLAAAEALKLGIIDSIAPGPILDHAIHFAIDRSGAAAGSKRPLRFAVPTQPADEIARARAAALRGAPRPNLVTAIDLVTASIDLPFDQALAREREAFQQLRVGPDAFALRHVFFAEREAARLPDAEQATPRGSSLTAVIGAGTMGSGIAMCALEAGMSVVLIEQDAGALQRGRQRIEAHFATLVTKGRTTDADAARALARLDTATDLNAASAADLVIEAVFEDIEVKRTLMADLGRVAKPGAVLASNTSYLDLDAIAIASGRPRDVLGLHFFSPAQTMKLLEVVRGAATMPDVMATGMQVAKRLRKIGVPSANSFGFIGNRIYAAYRRQCEWMLEDGAYPEEVDAALEAFGFAMGPFAVADLSGLDIAWRMRQARAATRPADERYVDIPDRLCTIGRLGRKTQAGYYRYDLGPGRQADPATRALVDLSRRDKGLTPRTVTVDEIQRRAMLAIVAESVAVISERVAARPDDIDVVLVNGYGFPKWRGGPVYWARQRGAEALAADLRWLAEVSGQKPFDLDLAALDQAGS